eukprot:scaffold4976_cov161-Amphora_coffeaeformis.AAC.16
MDDEMEDVWVKEPLDRQTPLNQHLQTLDASLRCEICRGLYCNPVSLNTCQHSFCSECIRNTLTEQSTRVRQGGPTCPSCRAPLDGRRHESNYRPNRSLARVVAAFTAVRGPLHQTLIKQTHSRTAGMTDHQSAAAAPEMERRGTKRTAADTTVHHLEPKRRMIYSHYKKKDLQGLCRNDGISTAGHEQQLKDRHQRFVVFWNSHVDNLEGCSKTAKQIVNEFNHQECERERLAVSDSKDKAYVAKVFERVQSGGSGSNVSKFEKNLNVKFNEMVADLRRKRQLEKKGACKKDASSEAPPAESTTPPNEPALEGATPTKEDVAKADTTSPELTNETCQQDKRPSLPLSPPTPPETDKKSDEVVVVDAKSDPVDSMVVLDAQNDLDDSVVGAAEPRETAYAPPPKRPRRGTSLTGPWSCPACTFLNEKRNWSSAKCEVCETARPKPSVH